MPKITFESTGKTGKTIEVPPGTELLEAARAADIEIDAPCGGKGACGKCIAHIKNGGVDSDSLGRLSAEKVNDGYVLACRCKIKNTPVTVDIPESLGKENGRFIDESDETHRIRDCFIKDHHTPQSLSGKVFLQVPQPRLQDGLSDIDRIARAFRQIHNSDILFSLPALRQTASALREQNGAVTLSISSMPHPGGDFSFPPQVVAVEPGDTRSRHFGIAVDIGTTTVAVQLVDLTGGKVMTTRTAYNDQLSCGLDVISRINYALKPHRLDELRSRVIKTINRLIHQLCREHQLQPPEILDAVIAGNTTMIHLFLGMDPEYIRLEPYTPTVMNTPPLTAGQTGIDIHPQSYLYICPSVGSYVGGDITSGLLCTKICKGEDIHLFIDIGTNGELVIGNHDFLVTCACSAGPAFEGGGIDHGMRAADGAIDNVEINPDTGEPQYRAIGSAKPKGICGSGMISLLANLFRTGWLDAAGKLNREKVSPNIEINGRNACYIVVQADETATGQPITVNERDIENIIRAKAAIYSAAALMLEQLGLDFDSLANIYIAGGFGRFLNIENAITLGLLPDVPREKFHYIGNSSLTGAYLTLVSQEHRQKQIELTNRMTYMELSTEPSYMHQYTGALFIPHTESNLFPSVK